MVILLPLLVNFLRHLSLSSIAFGESEALALRPAIRARAAQFSEAEIAADVDAALAEAHALSIDDRARLDAELEAIFAEIAADVFP